MNRRLTMALLTPVLAGILAVSGCSSAKHGSSATSLPPTTRQTATSEPNGGATATTRGDTSATSVPTSVPNDITARRNVAVRSCAAAPGGWSAAGTASNPTTSQVTYRITIFFTSSQATVEGFGDATVTVGPGQMSSWTVTTAIPVADSRSQCVLRGVGLS